MSADLRRSPRQRWVALAFSHSLGPKPPVESMLTLPCGSPKAAVHRLVQQNL